MNKHIELVKKWLADKDSVSKEELKANVYTVDVALYAAQAAANAAYYAYAAAYAAHAADYAADAADAEYWVNKYEDLV